VRGADPPIAELFTYDTPVPGIPTDCVTRPRVLTDTPAPLGPTLMLALVGDTVKRTPGAILKDLRARKPIFGNLPG